MLKTFTHENEEYCKTADVHQLLKRACGKAKKIQGSCGLLVYGDKNKFGEVAFCAGFEIARTGFENQIVVPGVQVSISNNEYTVFGLFWRGKRNANSYRDPRLLVIDNSSVRTDSDTGKLLPGLKDWLEKSSKKQYDFLNISCVRSKSRT